MDISEIVFNVDIIVVIFTNYVVDLQDGSKNFSGNLKKEANSWYAYSLDSLSQNQFSRFHS